MSAIDLEGMSRLVPYLWDAISKQPAHVADQLDAAVREGNLSLRFEPGGTGCVVVCTVAGLDVCEVDIQNLLDEDERPDLLW